MKLVVTIPAYNEEKTIAAVISEIPKKIKGIDSVDIIVVDDGSEDNTSAVAIKAGAKVIRNAHNCGLAYTFSKGLRYALELGADIIVNTDADMQYNQKQIPCLVQPILDGKADIVLGSRFKGTIEYMPIQKYLGNKIVSKLMSFLTGENITDSQTGFRAFSKEAALRINVFSNFTYTQETILEAVEKKLAIVEVPVDFRKRNGKSRLISNIFDYAYRAGSTILTTYLNYKPLKIFFFIGGFLIFIGLIFGTRILVHFISTGMVAPYVPSAILSALFLIIGFQIMIIGMIAELIKRNRLVQEELLYEQRKERLDK
jgi:glycosyltransferase involved in cell wall biosynthesis